MIRRVRHRAALALLLVVTTMTAVPATRADVIVEGDAGAVRLRASHAPVAEALSALRAAFNVQYRASIYLDRQVHGIYSGPLDQMIARVLAGYNYYVVKNDGGIEVVVFGTPGKTAVAAAAVALPPRKTSRGKDPAWEQRSARHRRPPAQRQ